MASVFETATRVAISEIIESHAKESKFGYVLTKEGFENLRDELFDFMKTSRSLKEAGDRFLVNQAMGQKPPKIPPRY